MSSSQGNQQTVSNGGSQVGSSTAPASSGSTNTIPQTAPPGTLSFTIPSSTATPSYYKIMANNPITFGWNFTSLLSTPASLTLHAYCTANGYTYPVGPTGSAGTVVGVIPGTATQVVWDAYQQQFEQGANPLQPETYTLRIFDERGWTVAAAPGLLNANQNLKFAMYTPAAYTPLESGWRCVTCSAATPNISSPSFMALGMTMIVMLISGIGLLRGLIRNW
ncbi:transmembrane protein [Rhizoctonia solani]|uniref:Transmembrane protein n=1 Tax=Rhizoctonia solani TaxID=456999 RepID=A0A8H8SZA6_9AGAM